MGRRDDRVERLLRERDPEMVRVAEAHDEHRSTVQEARHALKKLGVKAVFRNRWNGGDVDGYDLVVTLGGDGTLLWTSHVVPSVVPMLAINSAPRESVGYFAAGHKHVLEQTVSKALEGRMHATELTRMKVEVDGVTVSTRVLNDVLFCHECPAVTSRYLIRFGEYEEEQRSSGIWVGPAAGSTAAQRSAGGEVLPLDSPKLQFVVRELYRGGSPKPELDRGLVQADETLWLRSMMRDARLFLDGAHRVHKVDFGSVVTMCRSSEPLTLLGLQEG